MPAFLAPVSVTTTGNYAAIGVNPAATGAVRLANAAAVVARNGANSGDFVLMSTDSSNQLFLSTGANASSAAYFGDRSTDKLLTIQAASSANDIILNASSVGPTITLGSYGSLAAVSGKTGIQSPSGRPVGVAFTSSTFDIMSGGFTGTKVAEFGATYLALGTTPATSGTLRMPNGGYCYWKNAAGTANVAVLVMGADDNTYLTASTGHSVNLGLEGTANWLTSTATGTTVVGSFSVGGLTGATAASRLVGATTSGKPASGTFVKGDVVVDQAGKIWVNTTAGSPGTWTDVSSTTPYWSDAKWGVD